VNSVFTTQMKCAVVSTLISLAFVSQAFAVFSAKRNKRCRTKMHSSNQAKAIGNFNGMTSEAYIAAVQLHLANWMMVTWRF